MAALQPVRYVLLDFAANLTADIQLVLCLNLLDKSIHFKYAVMEIYFAPVLCIGESVWQCKSDCDSKAEHSVIIGMIYYVCLVCPFPFCSVHQCVEKC